MIGSIANLVLFFHGYVIHMCFVRILQELYAVLCDAAGYRVDEDHTPVLSCVDLAAILKQWVQKRHNTKVRDVS